VITRQPWRAPLRAMLRAADAIHLLTGRCLLPTPGSIRTAPVSPRI
jgi:hypothetical protein